jgi:hypothetical protein
MAASGPEDADDGASDAYQDEDDEDDVKSLHSDALDDDSDQEEKKKRAGKRKRASLDKSRRAKGSSPRKRRKSAASDEDEDEEGYSLKEGQQVVGKVVQAPKTGHGQCSALYADRGHQLIYHQSPPWSGISKYAQLPFAAHRPRVQRP